LITNVVVEGEGGGRINGCFFHAVLAAAHIKMASKPIFNTFFAL
jgi:hypothetical protein